MNFKAEVIVHLGNMNQGTSFAVILTNQYNHYTENKNNKRINLINRFGCDIKGDYHFAIIGNGDETEIKSFKTEVEDFLIDFFNNLKDISTLTTIEEILKEDFLDMPEIIGYKIVSVTNKIN